MAIFRPMFGLDTKPVAVQHRRDLFMSKRIIVMMLALLVSVASLSAAEKAKPAKAGDTAAATKSEKAPRLTLVEPVKDFGTIAKGDKLDWSFLVKNTGDADLQIIAAKPGCGCTV